MIPKFDGVDLHRNPEQFIKRLNDLVDRVNQSSRYNKLVVYNQPRTQKIEIAEGANGDLRIIRYNLDGDAIVGSTVVL